MIIGRGTVHRLLSAAPPEGRELLTCEPQLVCEAGGGYALGHPAP